MTEVEYPYYSGETGVNGDCAYDPDKATDVFDHYSYFWYGANMPY